MRAAVGGATVTLDGTIRKPLLGEGLKVKLVAEGQNLATLSGLVRTALPPLGPYRVAATATHDKDRLSLTGLAVILRGSDLAGNATLTLGKRLEVSAEITSNSLNIKDFNPEKKTDSSASSETGAAPTTLDGDDWLFSADPLPVAGLRAVDAGVTLKAGRILTDKLVLQNVDLTATLRGGRLELHPVLAELASGGRQRIDGSLDAPSAMATFDARITGREIDIGRLLKTFDAGDLVVARFDLKADLTGQGASVRALMAGLNGETEIVSGQGRVASRYLELLSGDVVDALTRIGAFEGDTRMNCFVSRFRITKGMADSTALLLDTECMVIAGEGRVDLASEALDFKLYPRPKNPKLINFATPLLIGGRLNAQTVLPDPAGLVQNIGRSVLGTAVGILTMAVPIGAAPVKTDANPCVAALARKPAAQRSTEPNPSSQPPQQGLGGAVEEAVKGVGDAIKSLFGK